MSFAQNPFALLAGREDGDVSDNETQGASTKTTKSAGLDAAPPKGGAGAATTGRNAPKGGIQSAQRRTVPGQTNTKPQKDADEAAAPTDAPAGGLAQFDGERGRDDRGAGFGRGGAARGARGGARGGDKDRRRGAGERRGAPGGQRLDRRSATGRTDTQKQEHQGWGGDEGKRELEAEHAGETDAAAEKNADGVPATPVAAEGDASAAAPAAAKAAAEDKGPEVPTEPEDNSLTYDEYLKQQKSAGRGALDSLELAARKANEGQDDSQWKDGVLVEKEHKVEDTYFLGASKEKAAKQRERKQKTFVEVDFTTAPPRDASRGRGRGRGEGRGGIARGGDRGRGRVGRGGGGRGAPRANGRQAVNVDDNKDFPSLS